MARLTPSPLTIEKNDGFDKFDIFNAKPFGERLAMIIEQTDEPLVIAIDGQWGSGKSVFAKQWAGLLRQRGVPVIEFDAFASDYQEDAFIALASEIVSYAKDVLKGHNKGRIQSFIKTSAKIAHAVMPVTAKILLKSATMGAISVEDVGKTGEQIADAAAADIGAQIEKAFQERLKSAESNTKTVEHFKGVLKDLAEKLTDAVRRQKPELDNKILNIHPRLVIIVDELDRCRPSFALDLLEKIKHFYNIDGVSFVFTTNIAQLQAAVKGRYGLDTDAATYLQKFISMRFIWNPAPNSNVTQQEKYLSECIKRMNLDLAGRRADILRFLLKAAKPSLRQVEKTCAFLSIHPVLYSKGANLRDGFSYLADIMLILVFLREIGIDVFSYKDRGKFLSDSSTALSLTNLDSEKTRHEEKWTYSLLSYFFVMEDSDIHQHIAKAINWDLHSADEAFKYIERWMRGEAVA